MNIKNLLMAIGMMALLLLIATPLIIGVLVIKELFGLFGIFVIFIIVVAGAVYLYYIEFEGENDRC